MALQANQFVNKLGKYLYRNIDGREKIKFTGNTCDVYFTVYYELPKNVRRVGYEEDWKLNSMIVNVSITTYQNKIRVNTISVTPEERTLGFDLYMPEEVQNVPIACQKIYEKVCKRVAKAFKQYNFVF